MNTKSTLFHQLDASPVLGVCFSQITILRLDLHDSNAPGNKWFKLQGNIAAARSAGIDTLVSFGGAWSNHLHALAATGRELGLQTVGIVRGEEPRKPSAMLRDAREWGMTLHYVSREEYRRRNEPAYLEHIRARFGPCRVVPEGGANAAGVEGCKGIADLLLEAGMADHKIVMAVATGTTLAGVAEGLGSKASGELVGVSVLKGAFDIDEKVATSTSGNCPQWRILHDYHCGGYARVNPALREFILAFQAVHKVSLDPVYTGKALYAVYQLLASGQWGSQPTVFIHTGGLQGSRGYSWLS